MIDEEFLKILACPETKKSLAVAPSDLVEKINQSIEKGLVVNKAGKKVEGKIDGGLVWEEASDRLYPVRDEIPVLLIDEAIPLEGL